MRLLVPLDLSSATERVLATAIWIVVPPIGAPTQALPNVPAPTGQPVPHVAVWPAAR